MRIALIDCDFNEQIALVPNPWLMKLSSYYKQKGDRVTLVDKVTNLNHFDLIVVAKEEPTSYLPPLNILTNKKTKVIGKALRRQPNHWDLPLQVFQARPDYHLYEFEFPSDFTRASFISLSYKGKFIESQKQTRVDRELAMNIVIDRDMWSSDDLGKMLDYLAGFSKVLFLEEVDLKNLKNNDLIKKFAKLRFYNRSIRIKKVSSLQELSVYLKVINQLQKLKNISIDNPTFITMTKELDGPQALERYFQCIEAAALSNEHRVKIDYLVPRDGVFTHSAVFEPFLKYQNHKKSFFSYLIEREFYKPANEVLENSYYWTNNTVASIWKIYYQHKNEFERGFIGWGGRPDQARKSLNEQAGEKFYDIYIL